jgi:DNA-binding MarR family transcriptional regulator
MGSEQPYGEPMPARVRELPTWVIARAAARSHRLLSEGFATAGVRGYHYRLLAALQEFGPASQADLGRRTAVDRSDVVAVLNELAGRGLVERAADAQDRRRNIVSITRAGSKQLRALDGVLGAVQERVLAPLTARERTQLMRLLDRISDPQS